MELIDQIKVTESIAFLGEIPLDLDIRLASDKGEPIALTNTPASMAYKILADKLISGGMAWASLIWLNESGFAYFANIELMFTFCSHIQ